MNTMIALLLTITAGSALLLTALLLIPRRGAGEPLPLSSQLLLAFVAGAAFVAGLATGVLA